MAYLKNFFIGFSIVFFVNYLFPGIDIVSPSKIPHIGGDMIFAALLGLCNSLIYPLLRGFDRNTTIIRVAIVTFILNFLAYALLKLLSIGMYVTSVEGYLSASIAVSLGSVLLSYVQFRRNRGLPSS